ncbi:MAG: GNAT family N-acetyltransferase [Leptolyngbyaceae cyanobacterium SM1_3_5]|nr:GNAT family N-acetyltransferase [Leptolyngbyaceae cyanobacterium SM1_3_5]
MKTNIRAAKPEDVAALTKLLRSLGLFAHLSAESIEVSQQRIAHHFALCDADESHSVYVAEQEGEAIGYAAVHWLPSLFLAAPEGYISELFVHESARGQGIGTRLLETVKAEAQRRNCSRLTLVNHRDRESYQRKFYEKQGWRERQNVANFVYVLK